MKKIFWIALISLLIGCNRPQQNVKNSKKYVIILSLDGFRWDYPDLYNTPVLDSIAKNGVRGEMIPVFPTKTFVNHYTLATGLYADNHGIVLNNFYAPDLGENYNMKTTAGDGKFYGGEPVWVTAEKQGVKAATLFWVGSEAEIKGKRPTYWYKYNQSLSFDDRINQVINWLKLPYEKRPHLIMWYYHEPDASGHHNGPESEKTKEIVEQIDSWLGSFMKKLNTLPLADSVDFIIVSDHGMAKLSPDKQVIIDDYIDTSMLQIINGGNPVYNFKIKEGYKQKVLNKLSEIDNIDFWEHGKLPERLHYGKNPRTLDVTVVAKPGWGLYFSWQNKNGKGTHGYDNSFRDMDAIFFATGPDFKKDYKKSKFENVDIYPLLCKLLNLQPAKNDGKLDEIKDVLNK